MDRSRIVLAGIVRPRGNRGELLAKSLTDVPGRLETLEKANIRLADGSDREVEVEECWSHKELWVLKFAGVDTIDQAQPFSGADLWVSPDQRAVLEEGQYYQTDLIGCRLWDAANDELVGVVKGWQDYGAGPLMEIDRQGKEVLIPFARALCRKVDLEDSCIVMDLPEGLLDL